MEIANKKTWIGVLFLIFIEQSIKIIINNFFLHQYRPILPPLLYFKPMFNRDYSWLNSMLQLGISKWLHIAVVVIAILLINWFYLFLNERIGPNHFINLIFAFIFSSAICSLLDKVFWNGSLDYILVNGLFTFDLKDVYINIAIGLLILLIITKNQTLKLLDEQNLMKDFPKFMLRRLQLKPNLVLNDVSMMNATPHAHPPIVETDFNCQDDFTRINDFLIETYRLYNALHNWDIARWTFNRYCIHGQEELANQRGWERFVRIWETTNREIVAVAHIEEPGEYFFQVHPHYTYLEEAMLNWAIHNSTEKILVFALESDLQRKTLYEKYQATKVYTGDSDRMLILKRDIQPDSLPKHFKIINFDHRDQKSCEKISHLYRRIWPTSTYIPNGETVASLTTSPIYRKELSFVALAPNDSFAAFCFVWYDSVNQVGHFYPIGTDPDYLGLNLNQALIENALATLQAMDCKKAFICGYYEADDEALFNRLGFERLEKGDYFEIRK